MYVGKQGEGKGRWEGQAGEKRGKEADTERHCGKCIYWGG